MNYYANDYAPLVAAKIHFKITPTYILVQPRVRAVHQMDLAYTMKLFDTI